MNEPIRGNPYNGYEFDRRDWVDYPVSPAWAAHYASIGMYPATPAVEPIKAPPWQRTTDVSQWMEPRDVGESSPLWDELRHLWTHLTLESPPVRRRPSVEKNKYF